MQKVPEEDLPLLPTCKIPLEYRYPLKMTFPIYERALNEFLDAFPKAHKRILVCTPIIRRRSKDVTYLVVNIFSSRDDVSIDLFHTNIRPPSNAFSVYDVPTLEVLREYDILFIDFTGLSYNLMHDAQEAQTLVIGVGPFGYAPGVGFVNENNFGIDAVHHEIMPRLVDGEIVFP